MEDLLQQIDAASAASMYYLALTGALVVPSVANALGHRSGEDQGCLAYGAWYDRWVRRPNDFADGEAIYRLPCSLLHQAGGDHPKSQFERVVFVKTAMLHNNRINETLQLSAVRFCGATNEGCRRWLSAVAGTEPFETNKRASFSRYPDGLRPFIGGVPVIG